MHAALPLTARAIPSDYRLRMPGPAAIPERVRAATALEVREDLKGAEAVSDEADRKTDQS